MIRGNINDFIDNPYLKIPTHPHVGLPLPLRPRSPTIEMRRCCRRPWLSALFDRKKIRLHLWAKP